MVESIHKGSTAYIQNYSSQEPVLLAQTLDEFNKKNCIQIKANVSQVLALENPETLQIFVHHGSF